MIRAPKQNTGIKGVYYFATFSIITRSGQQYTSAVMDYHPMNLVESATYRDDIFSCHLLFYVKIPHKEYKAWKEIL